MAKRLFLLSCLCCLLFGAQTVHAGTGPPCDGSSVMGLAQAVLVLRTIAAMPSASTGPLCDINGDGRIGLPEAVYALQVAAGIWGKSFLPDTGQTMCYDASDNSINCAGTGQDGAYTIHPMSFAEYGNGMVTDNVTGLLWQKCAAGQNIDAACSGTTASYNWYEASGTVDATGNPNGADICGSLSLGGYLDWRLPTKKELMGLVDYGTSNPAVVTAFFPNTQASGFWSSSPLALNPTSTAWAVSFKDGDVVSAPKTNTAVVRCVRGQSPSQVFIDNGDGTVIDNATGLMWQQRDDNSGKTWPQALDYCNALQLAGHGDWRLPNVKELASINNEAASNPAINTAYFPYTHFAYWSSTSSSTSHAGAEVVDFTSGFVADTTDKINANYYVRCVR